MKKVNENFHIDTASILGKGAFGVVYKGVRVDEGRIIAVKYITPEQMKNNEKYERELEVMDKLSKLNHPNIVGYYGYEKKPDGLFCFLEFCAGGQLKPFCKKKISEIRVMALFEQLLDAMVYINKENFLHRDLKPENILLDENLDLKIADFGLARNVQLEMTKGACTPLYAAPQVYNLGTYEMNCDVWSAGMILYEMLTGVEVLRGIKSKGELKEWFQKVKKGEKIFKYPKELHENWTFITEFMLVHDKTKRPSFEQVLKMFRQLKEKMEIDLNSKYDTNLTDQKEITDSKKRLKLINPYLTKKLNDSRDPIQKFKEESSYKKLQAANSYLLFTRLKVDFITKIIKSFTDNPYKILKNVYKYILMFLAISSLIFSYTTRTADLSNGSLFTPEGWIKAEDIAEEHKKDWSELMNDAKSKCKLAVERFSQVLEKQIVNKITSSYMNREEERKILGSYEKLIEWILETRKGNFMKPRFYSNMFIKVMNDSDVHINDIKMQTMEMKDLRTYALIRLTGYVDSWLPQKNFRDEDFIPLKKQEFENFNQKSLAEYLVPYNLKLEAA